MKIGILGRKVGMTQIFDEKGATIPVTVIHAADCFITQVKSKGTDGYNAVQIAYGNRKPQSFDKAMLGHFKKAGVQAKAELHEIRLEESDDVTQIKAGQELSVTMFKQGDIVDAIGQMKGRGNAGVFKRFNYHGKHATHGTSKYFRHGGSNGANTFPGRVLKNKGMPGRMGGCPRTMPNLKIVGIRAEDNLLLIRGAVPGARNSTVMIKLTQRSRKSDGRGFAPVDAPAEV